MFLILLYMCPETLTAVHWQVYAPSSAIWWGSYGFIRRKLHQLSLWSNFNASKHNLQATSGALAGIVATLATNPIDVARTRLQLEGPTQNSQGTASNTIRSTLVKLWRQEGPKCLMKGVQVRGGYSLQGFACFTSC